MADVRSFEDYFENRGVAAEPQPDTGDYKLVWRSGVVYQRLDVDLFAAIYMASNVTSTGITVTDQWEAIGGTFLAGQLADVWSLAANQLTYAGPTVARPTLITANASVTVDAGGPEDAEIGIFVNDVLVQNSIRATLTINELTALTCSVLHPLTVGDVVDLRVRNRSGTEDVTVSDAHLVIP